MKSTPDLKPRIEQRSGVTTFESGDTFGFTCSV